MKALGLTVLNSVNAARAVGIDAGPALFHGLSFDRARLEAGLVWVPWDEVAELFNRLEPHFTSDRQLTELTRVHMTTHPAIRIVAQFAASPLAWFDLFWRMSVPVNPMARMSHWATSEELGVEQVLHEGLAPCRLWFRLSHEAAACTFLPLGGALLETASVDVSPRHVCSRFVVPLEHSSEERLARASAIPLSTVFASLELLGAHLGPAIHDGHLRFGASVRGHVDEVATLAETWGVTLSEARVALSLAEGRTPAEVARALDVAVATVRVHLKHLYAKTETSGQRELVERVRSWRLR
jgi:DNA-binding CsgD family transcriptional regulator